MPDGQTQAENEVEVEIKEFGNSAHAIVPKEMIGETAVVSVVSDITRLLSEPVGVTDIRCVLQSVAVSDFHSSEGGDISLDEPGSYIFRRDTRLRVEISLNHEYISNSLYDSEYGTILFVHEPNFDEIQDYIDDDRIDSGYSFGDVLWRVDKLAGVIENPIRTSGQPLFTCDIYWDDNLIESFDYQCRTSEVGVIPISYRVQYDSVSEYVDSFRYDILTGLSDVSDEVYMDYLNLVGDEYFSAHDSGINPCRIGIEDDDDLTISEVADIASIIRVGDLWLASSPD